MTSSALVGPIPSLGPGRIRRLAGAVAVIAALTGPALAIEIDLPANAALSIATPVQQGSHPVATGPWMGGLVPLRTLSGNVAEAVWTIPADDGLTVAALAADLEAQITSNGPEIAFSCADRACGGFDFRSAMNLGPSPEMHVDIGNFRYIAAIGDDSAFAVTVSQGGQTLYLHLASVTSGDAADSFVTPSTRTPEVASTPEASTVPDRPILNLAEFGALPLEDLNFRTGASELSGNDYSSLIDLAAFLAQNSERRVMLVGHTDAEGGLESNIALSEARARAVRRHLIERLDVNPRQVEAAGIGFLAPRATNETADGREANRRVEVVLLDAG